MKPFAVIGRPKLLRRIRFVTTRDFWIDSLHLFPLCGFAVAQPIYDLLGQYPEFFVVRGSQPADIILLVLTLSLLIPLSLVLVQLAAGLFGRPARKGVHAAIVAAFIAIFALMILKKLMEPHAYWMLALSACIGLVGSWSIINIRPMQNFLTILSLSVVVFPVFILYFSPVSMLLLQENSGVELSKTEKSNNSIFMIIFDELPLSSLMDRNYLIDNVRYPHFAELADTSYWFRNGTSNGSYTTVALPAILTGKLQNKKQLPIYKNFKKSLFTLVSRSHNLFVSEKATRICPIYLCEKKTSDQEFLERYRLLLNDLYIVYLHIILPITFTDDLPSVTQNWGTFANLIVDKNEIAAKQKLGIKDIGGRRKITCRECERERRLTQFLDSIQTHNRPGLYYFHTGYPHRPWRRLPTGKLYRTKAKKLSPRWGSIEIVVTRDYQRHLLTVGYVDYILGSMLAKIREVGLFENSLIIVTSDHGVTVRPNYHTRLQSQTNVSFGNVAHVPFFIKLPYQTQGYIRDDNVESIDILPTISEVIGIDIPWSVDGHSVFDTSVAPRKTKHIYALKQHKLLTYDSAVERLFDSVDHKISIFGSNNEVGLYRIGKHSNLVAAKLGDNSKRNMHDIHYVIDQEEAFEQVELDGSFIPADITGRLTGKLDGSSVDLALVKGNTIVATTETYNIGGETVEFSFVVPETIFDTGKNLFKVYIIESDEQGKVAFIRLDY